MGDGDGVGRDAKYWSYLSEDRKLKPQVFKFNSQEVTLVTNCLPWSQ